MESETSVWLNIWNIVKWGLPILAAPLAAWITVLLSVKKFRSQKFIDKKIEALSELISLSHLFRHSIERMIHALEDDTIPPERIKELLGKYNTTHERLYECFGKVFLFISKSGRRKFNEISDSVYIIDMNKPGADLSIITFKKFLKSLDEVNEEMVKLFKNELGLK